LIETESTSQVNESHKTGEGCHSAVVAMIEGKEADGFGKTGVKVGVLPVGMTRVSLRPRTGASGGQTWRSVSRTAVRGGGISFPTFRVSGLE
jgi:hypothetical protein